LPTLMTPSKSTGGKPSTRGHQVIKWIELHCRFTNAQWYGKPFVLLPWQRSLILGLFEVDPETRKRLIRWAYVSVPKKNGKTELMAALALWFLVASEEPVPLIVCAAGSDDQADELFGAVSRMVEASPTLSQICETYESEVLCPSVPGGKIIRSSATARKNSSNLDGKNIFVVICDELHVWEGDRGRIVWGTLTRGTVVRDEPMVLQITTAGFDKDSICYEQYSHAKKVIAGTVDDPAFFAYIAEAPEKAPHDDPQQWRDANPSFGAVMQERFYHDQLSKQPENEFRRFYMNQWTESAESWLPPGAWQACEDPSITIPAGADITVGIDVALYHDHTAVVIAHKTDEGRIVVRARTWEPPADGSGIDAADVVAHVRQLSLTYNIVAASYDPRFFDVPARTLADEGVPMLEEPQSPERMVPACGNAYSAIIAKTVTHDGDPVLTAHVLSAAQRASDRGWTLSKGKSKAKIDACIALVLALWKLEAPVETTPEPVAFYA
jgi:phage terminase large subunit-like protein